MLLVDWSLLFSKSKFHFYNCSIYSNMLEGWLCTTHEIGVFHVRFQSGDTQTADYKSTSTEAGKRDASREYHNEWQKMKMFTNVWDPPVRGSTPLIVEDRPWCSQLACWTLGGFQIHIHIKLIITKNSQIQFKPTV